MEYTDINNKPINDDDAILFTLEDSVAVGGFNNVVSNVKLCFWSKIEQRYIPFSEIYDTNIPEVKVVTNSLNLN